MHALLNVLPTKRMLPLHIFKPFCTYHPADEILSDDASMLQGLATVATSHHDAASSCGGQTYEVQSNDSCPNLPRPSTGTDSARDSNTQWFESLTPFWASLVQAGESEEPSVGGVRNEVQDRRRNFKEHSEPETEQSVQGSGQEDRSGDGAHACEAARVKDAQQRCHAAGNGARLHHGLVIYGREQGEGSVQSHAEGRVEGNTASAGHTGSCSFPCAHVTDETGAHEGIRCEPMST